MICLTKQNKKNGNNKKKFFGLGDEKIMKVEQPPIEQKKGKSYSLSTFSHNYIEEQKFTQKLSSKSNALEKIVREHASFFPYLSSLINELRNEIQEQKGLTDTVKQLNQEIGRISGQIQDLKTSISKGRIIIEEVEGFKEKNPLMPNFSEYDEDIPIIEDERWLNIAGKKT